MRFFSVVALLVSLLLFSVASSSQAEGPVYSRNRGGGRGGYHGGGRHGGRFNHYGYFGYQPFIAGSWYARPYPYHFEYYRWRYSAPPQTPDCPCAPVPVEQ